MKFAEGISQKRPAHSEEVRRNLGVELVASTNSKFKLAASGPEVCLQLSYHVCKDCRLCMAHGCHDAKEHEEGGDQCPCAFCVRGEDMRGEEDKAGTTAAAQMPKTKPKARAAVAHGQLNDGDEAASLRDQYFVPSIKVTGTVSWDDPRGTSHHQSTTSNRTSPDCSDLCNQVNKMKLQTEREKSKNTRDVCENCETNCNWGLPKSRAPNCNLGTTRRTKCLLSAGILPQEQIRVKGFSGTPFRLP